MTTALASLGGVSGLITPSKSTATSESAKRIEDMQEAIRRHLLSSYTMRSALEHALNELEEVRAASSEPGWNGYGAKPLHAGAYECAKVFLSALPTTAPLPEVSADPDGDVALDWVFGQKKALSVSIGPTGRCTFAWMRGQCTYRGTDWLDNEIPGSIAYALSQLARDTVRQPSR